MVQTNVFDYVRILDKAADASWLRNQAISNNIANVDTPGYKRQDLNLYCRRHLEATGISLWIPRYLRQNQRIFP